MRWNDHTGKRKSQVFNTRRDADLFLSEQRVITEKIKAGLMAPPCEVVTFVQLAEYWLKNRASFKRSGHHDKSIIACHLLPHLNDKTIASIRPIDVEGLRHKLKNHSDKTVHNILTLLITMLNAAKDQGWLLSVPKIKKPKVKLIDRNFRYLKTKEEIYRFLNAAHTLSPDLHDLYAVAINTGLRAGELGALKFDDVDFNGNFIIVNRSWDGPTKSGESRIVPIFSHIRSIILKRKQVGASEYVFTNLFGNPLRPSDRVFQEKLKHTLVLAKFPLAEINGKKVPYVNFHGLRHTFASHWAMAGVDPFRLQKVLGHQDIKMTLRYSHLAKHAFDDLDGKILETVPLTEKQDVISLYHTNVRKDGHENVIPHKTPREPGQVGHS